MFSREPTLSTERKVTLRGVDFLLRVHRDKAIARNDAPRIVTIDESGANQAAL
jgi:hypothetical protein